VIPPNTFKYNISPESYFLNKDIMKGEIYMAETIENTTTTEIAILLDDHVDKYHTGIQAFRLQSVNGLQNNTREQQTFSINIPNLMNKDPIDPGKINTSSVVKIKLPREVTRDYPVKYIPVGTRFIVTFNSGDITKPVIIGREE
jgi:hypothetical protein